ncbi:MAG: hypothetical protein ACKVQR_08270 [Aquabacterium sp.]
MHRWILGAPLLLALGSTAAAPLPACRAVVERFVSADCPACWAAGPAAAPPSQGVPFVLDWVVPTTADAALEAAALVEAAERLQRAGRLQPGSASEPAQRQPLPRPPRVRLDVSIGPAWHGYFGVQLLLRGRPPTGSKGYVALVEELPAGTDGSAVARTLVRSVAGPLNLDAATPGRPLRHLQSLSWPETAQPQRLSARGWVERPDGRVLAVAGGPCR